MNFIQWYAMGVVVLLMLFSWDTYNKSNYSIKIAANEVYDTLVRRADALSTSVLLITALAGPLLVLVIAYFIFRAWLDSLAVDEDDNRIYPWSKE